MPFQTFAASATTNAASETVWEHLDRSETWEGITGVDEVFDEVRGPFGELQGFKFYSSLGGRRYIGSAAPDGRVEGRSLTWNIQTPEIKGSITVALKAAETSTVVDVTMRVESVSVIAAMAFPFIAAAIGNGFQATVDDFVTGLAG